MISLWILVFIISLVVLIKSADLMLSSSERFGLAIGLSPFIVGVTIVGLGTSLPELVSSFVAISRGVTEIVAANVFGSNIANILLVVGLSAVIGRRLVVTKSLIDLDLPLLAIGTTLVLGVAWDKQITIPESVLLLVTYAVYFLYTIIHKDDGGAKDGHEPISLAVRKEKYIEKVSERIAAIPKLKLRDFGLFTLGVIGLFFGAKYLIDAVVNLSGILNIEAGVIAISALAIGTSLPELVVSIKAAMQKKSEIALGTVFGSNIFNMLVVIGLPGLFGTLSIDDKTFAIGMPVMALATLLFVFSGISRRIHIWEGAFFLLFYIFFLGKVLNFL